jgi:hypothetical protein
MSFIMLENGRLFETLQGVASVVSLRRWSRKLHVAFRTFVGNKVYEGFFPSADAAVFLKF